MPLTPRPLAPLALRLVEIPGIPRVRGVQAVGLARLPTLIRGGASPLRRAAEQHPAQHRDLLRQLRDPGIGLRERLLGPHGTLTPHVTTGGHSDSARPPTGSPNTYSRTGWSWKDLNAVSRTSSMKAPAGSAGLLLTSPTYRGDRRYVCLPRIPNPWDQRRSCGLRALLG